MKVLSTLTLVLALAFASPLWAGNVTIDLDNGDPIVIDTTKYQTAIQALADEFNLHQPNLPDGTLPPNLTRNEYTEHVFKSAFKSYKRQVAKRNATKACVRFKALSDAKKQAITDELGGFDPCDR